MKVFFLYSPRGQSTLNEEYGLICNSIEKLGHKNVSEFINEIEVEKLFRSDPKKFHIETIKSLKNADICIFETSVQSMGIGHIIGMALQLNKPVIAMYNGEHEPFFLSGANDDKIQIFKYNKEKITEVLADAIDYAASQQDVRFNFFISPAIGNYLDWISKEKKIPRSVYLRGLIEKGMENNDEYNS